jgi:flagellar hook-associated protein 3 FlgL
MMKPISTFGQTAARNANLRRLENDLAIADQEVATQKKSDVAKSLGSDLLNLQSVRNQIDENAAYKRSIDLFKQRYEMMDSSFGQMTSSIESLVEVAAINSADALDTAVTVKLVAKGVLDDITTSLNLSIGGRYLFSGEAVDTPPARRPDDAGAGPESPRSVIAAAIDGTMPGAALPATDLRVPTTVAESDALLARFDSIFQGGNFAFGPPQDDFSFENVFFDGEIGGILSEVRLPGNNYTSVQNDTLIGALRDVMQGAWILNEVNREQIPDDAAYQRLMTGDGAGVRGALDLISEGLDTIRSVRANMGITYQQVDAAEETLGTQDALLSAQRNTFEGVDGAEATSRLLELENQLRISYEATSRVMNLSLFNFIR